MGMAIVVLGVTELLFAGTKPSSAAFERSCGQCHDINRSASKTKTRKDWDKVVARMMKKLETPEFAITSISKDDAKQIVDYLFAEHGYKNMQENKAEERKAELLKKMAADDAQENKTEERKTELLKKALSPDSQENKAEERKAELLKKAASSGTLTAEERKAKLFEKFTPSKARTVSKRAKTVNQEKE